MRILMVCLGNICRSPLAEGILQHKLGKNIEVDSCGTSSYHEGDPPDLRSIEIAKKYGIDISTQKSRPITPEDFKKFDKIYVMDQSNYENVVALTTDSSEKEKVKLILSEIPNTLITEVPDPYFGNEGGFEKVYALLDVATDFIAKQIQSY